MKLRSLFIALAVLVAASATASIPSVACAEGDFCQTLARQVAPRACVYQYVQCMVEGNVACVFVQCDDGSEYEGCF